MFENYDIEGIYISRFIASWQKAKGNCRKDYGLFKEWLGTLIINGRHLTDEEIHDILFIADNGKLELELSAKMFLKKNEKMEEIKKIAKELETFVAIPSWQMENIIYWWNSLIWNFGSVSIGDVIDFFKSAYLIDDMETKPKYYKWGFTEGLVENKNFAPCESISGRWIFTIKLPEIKDLTNE